MRLIALIPARGGSKGIPRKNLAPLGGRPLIAWTIEAALSAGCFGKVVVSTDDEEIAAVARDCGAEVPFLRPAEFSGDMAPALAVVQHALTALPEDRATWDAVAYLQPTSPFRTSRQLVQAVEAFDRFRPDTLVSVLRVPHNMVPGALMNPVAGEEGLWLETPAGQVMRRQDKAALFARNGPAILIMSVRDITGHNQLYGQRVMGFEMDRVSSLDIDDPLDLDIARCLLPLADASSRL